MHAFACCQKVVPRLEIFQALTDTGTFFTRNFAGLGQRAGADAGKEWISGSSRPYVAKSQSGIEGIRLLEMLNRCFRNHFGQSLQGAVVLVKVQAGCTDHWLLVKTVQEGFKTDLGG